MREGETELDMVRRHVSEGLSNITRQHEIIARICNSSHPTEMAKKVLAAYLTVQVAHEAHLSRLEGR